MKSLKEQFIDWVNKQDPRKRYRFVNRTDCPIATFGKEMGYLREDDEYNANSELLKVHNELVVALAGGAENYGAFQERLKARRRRHERSKAAVC